MSSGNSGNNGAPGDSGSVFLTQSGGGGSETQLEPGAYYFDGNFICVDWYYVYYQCVNGVCTEYAREFAFTYCYLID
jgi:hypothetical protein